MEDKRKSYKLRVREKSVGAKNYKKDNEYYTPKELVATFGHFDYDPATNEEKAKEFGIKDYDTIETDGLKRDWTKFKRIWINPPFSDKFSFIKKACETYRQSHNDIYILFPVEFMTTKQFHTCLNGEQDEETLGGTLFLPNGRIKFCKTDTDRKLTSPAFGSVILKLGEGDTITIERIKI